MNDKQKTFVCEQTGERFKNVSLGTLKDPTKIMFTDEYGYVERVSSPESPFSLIVPIIEPKLEVGDWLEWRTSNSLMEYPLRKINYGGDFPVNLYHQDLLEVRKANGERWINDNGEWRKL